MSAAKDSAVAQLLALQAEVNALEADKGKQRQKAEQLLWDKSQPLYQRRRQIVTGEKEPSKEELGKFDEEHEAEGQASSIKDAKASKGIPNFWLRVLKHQDTIAEQIRKPDEAALVYLEDVRIKKPKGAAGYRVEFEFASNPYFSDKVLWKEVLLESDDLPISAAVVSEAPPIKWRKDMNLTVRQVVKKAKSGKGKGKAKEGATTLKTKPTQSFFNFFGRGTSKGRKQTDREAEEDEDEDEEEEEGAAAAGDVPTGHADMILAVWNDVVPNAVELYMSEGLTSQGIESEGDDYEMVGGSEAERDGLPLSAQRRLRALQFLHQQRVALKQARDSELRKIEDDFAERAQGLLDRRRFVVVGKERSTERQALAVTDGAKKSGPVRPGEDMVVPRFWLLALKGCPVTVELIRRADERILAYLADIRAARLPKGLRIDFEFLPNPFLENEVLSRTYTLTDDTQVVVETEATPVRWREGVYDITAKKGKSGSSKSGSAASFFSLFTKDGAQRVFAGDSRTPLTGTELRDRETALALTLRDVVIPRAVDLYQVAAAWNQEEEASTASEEDTESDGDLDRDEIRRRVKGKAGRGRRRGGSDGDEWTCCGLSRTQVLILLSLLIALPQVLYLVDMLFARRH